MREQSEDGISNELMKWFVRQGK